MQVPRPAASLSPSSPHSPSQDLGSPRAGTPGTWQRCRLGGPSQATPPAFGLGSRRSHPGPSRLRVVWNAYPASGVRLDSQCIQRPCLGVLLTRHTAVGGMQGLRPRSGCHRDVAGNGAAKAPAALGGLAFQGRKTQETWGSAYMPCPAVTTATGRTAWRRRLRLLSIGAGPHLEQTWEETAREGALRGAAAGADAPAGCGPCEQGPPGGLCGQSVAKGGELQELGTGSQELGAGSPPGQVQSPRRQPGKLP